MARSEYRFLEDLRKQERGKKKNDNILSIAVVGGGPISERFMPQQQQQGANPMAPNMPQQPQMGGESQLSMSYTGTGPDGVLQPSNPANMVKGPNGQTSMTHEGEIEIRLPDGTTAVIPANEVPQQFLQNIQKRTGMKGYQSGTPGIGGLGGAFDNITKPITDTNAFGGWNTGRTIQPIQQKPLQPQGIGSANIPDQTINAPQVRGSDLQLQTPNTTFQTPSQGTISVPQIQGQQLQMLSTNTPTQTLQQPLPDFTAPTPTPTPTPTPETTILWGVIGGIGYGGQGSPEPTASPSNTEPTPTVTTTPGSGTTPMTLPWSWVGGIIGGTLFIVLLSFLMLRMGSGVKPGAGA